MIQQIKNGIIGLLGISLVILIHEAGHFLACKLCGVKTLVFSIGFDPALISFRFLKTTFQIGLLPIGGYVSIDPYSLAVATFTQKMIIIFAGIAANIISALLIFNYLSSVGFQPEQGAQEGSEKQTGFMGPVGIIALIGQSATQGFDSFIYLLGIISINIALFNLLPIPPFDGAQAAYYIIQATTGKTFTGSGYDTIQNGIILILMILTLILAFRDLKQLFKR